MTASVAQAETSDEALRRRIAELETSLATSETKLAKVTEERDKLRRAYEQLKEQLELLRRRIYVAKAERLDVRQLELEFEETKAKLRKMAQELGDTTEPPSSPESDEAYSSGQGTPPDKPKRSGSAPTGRRDLRAQNLPEERIEIVDPLREGKAERIGFDESSRSAYRRGGPICLVVARAVYKEATADGQATLTTAEKPKELFERGMLAPTMMAHILVQKYRFGLPFHRLVLMLAGEGFRLDDGTMCRYAEDVGATLGVLVDAMAKEAKATAFCLATDATGVAIQPEPLASGRRQSCRRGHFFVVLADQDHVFFEYQPRHTSKAVCEMFRGFSGYVQADAHGIYDALFRGGACTSVDEKPPNEVGCWSHCRRRFWEAATAAKEPLAREALLRIRALFQLEETWKKLAPQQRHEKRQKASRAIIDDFFAWAKEKFETVKSRRSLLASAFGYAVRQEGPLRRFLDDGRLRLENNPSERALRGIAVGRRAWLFFGDDDHAQAAANLFSLIASCVLHHLDPETYLAEIIHVMPYWPRARYLELAPKYWARTRARLAPKELALEIGVLTVPPPLPAEEQSPTG